MAIWWIWKWRNEVVYRKEERSVAHKVYWLKHYEKEVVDAYAKAGKPTDGTSGTGDRRMNWMQPSEDWVALNTDACFKKEDEPAGCSGALQDSNGSWMGGFNCTIKANNSAEAECWAVLKALQCARNKNLKKLLVQRDSREVVDWINSKGAPIGPLSGIVTACKNCIEEGEHIMITHVFHEQNYVADGLTKIAVRKGCDWIEFDGPPREVSELLRDNCTRGTIGTPITMSKR